MQTAEYSGINTFLVGMSDLLLSSSVERITRSFKCFELPNPIIIKITNPCARLVTIPERNWQLKLAYAESFWIASGRNDLKFINHYSKKIQEFSDDGDFMRAGYGARVRFFNGVADDYKQNETLKDTSQKINTSIADQLKFVIQCFQKDIKTRQALISIADPVKDDFDINGNLKSTKDYPCTRDMQFIQNSEGKLDMIVHMRSNDFIWGASAVNIFNYTFMQEYVSHILNMEIGNYYHIANNFHYYERHIELLKELSKFKNVNDDNYYVYDKSVNNLEEFDANINLLSNNETNFRNKNFTNPHIFESDFFNDWSNVFQNVNGVQSVDFKNPVLNSLTLKNK